MKNRKCLVQHALSGLFLVLLALLHPCAFAAPLGTAFTYQGRLSDGGSLATGSYDLKFSLYDANLVGNLVGTPTSITLAPVLVSNGLFTVTLNFGSATFSGEARWLEIAVRTNGSLSAHTTLAPRQSMTPSPYAIFATSVPWSGLTSVPTGFSDGSAFWKTGGNIGTLPGLNFVGTSDLQPLELKANNQRALRLEPAFGSPNLIGGSSANSVLSGAIGATISGGGIGGSENFVTDHFGTVGGGAANQAGDNAGPYDDRVYATVGGGYGNVSSGKRATVSGGFLNTAAGESANVAGGEQNLAVTNYSSVAGGHANTSTGYGASIAGGELNSSTRDFAAIGGGSGNVASNGFAVVSGGSGNFAGGYWSSVGGGVGNMVSGQWSTIGGGQENVVTGLLATVAGGTRNIAGGWSATVAGGDSNEALGFDSCVPGGVLNVAAGKYSFAAGRQAKADHDGSFVWADDHLDTGIDFHSQYDNQFRVRAYNGARFDDGTSLWVEFNRLGGKPIDTSTTAYLSGGGTWVNASDVNRKENFAPVDSKEILERASRLAITTWNYRAEALEIRHLGPTAQDFSAAFGLGADDKHISTVDESGVALAAIQGLHELMEEQQNQIKALENANALLQQKLELLQNRFRDLERPSRHGTDNLPASN
jgi:hypothetical protein